MAEEKKSNLAEEMAGLKAEVLKSNEALGKALEEVQYYEQLTSDLKAKGKERIDRSWANPQPKKKAK